MPRIERTRSSYSYDRELTSDRGQSLYKPTSLEDFKNLIQYNRKSSSKSSKISTADKRFSVIQEEPEERRESVSIGGTLV